MAKEPEDKTVENALEDGVKEIIIRKGDAPKIFQKEPLVLIVQGNIDAPAAFAAVRKPNPRLRPHATRSG